MHARDVRADLAQRHREEVQSLEADSLIGRDQHSAALVELHEIFLRADAGRRDARALLHALELLVVIRRNGRDRAVVHAVKIRHGRSDVGQDVAFHALAHHAGDELREQHGRFARVEKLFHHVAARALDVDIKALELALKGVQPLERRALVVLARVERFEHLQKTSAVLAVHALFELHIFILISHLSFSSLKLDDGLVRRAVHAQHKIAAAALVLARLAHAARAVCHQLSVAHRRRRAAVFHARKAAELHRAGLAVMCDGAHHAAEAVAHLPTVPFALTFTMSPSLTAPQTNVAHHSPMPS